MFNWLKHAFAVDVNTAPPSEEQMRVADRLAREIVRRRLTTPALAFLEMSRPMNFLGAQAMVFFAPVATALFDAAGYNAFAQFLERRDAIDLLSTRIESLERTASELESGKLPSDAKVSERDKCESDRGLT